MIRLLAGVLATLLFSAAGCARAPTPAPASATAAPASARDFRDVTIGDLDGRPTRLPELLGRRPALLSFWAPWCEPCVREQPALQQLAQQVSTCGATVLGVAVGETRHTIAAFTRRRGLTFPQVTDQEFHLADALGQRRIPTTLVLDGDQNITFVGQALDHRAITALQTLLTNSGTPSPCPELAKE